MKSKKEYIIGVYYNESEKFSEIYTTIKTIKITNKNKDSLKNLENKTNSVIKSLNEKGVIYFN